MTSIGPACALALGFLAATQALAVTSYLIPTESKSEAACQQVADKVSASLKMLIPEMSAISSCRAVNPPGQPTVWVAELATSDTPDVTLVFSNESDRPTMTRVVTIQEPVMHVVFDHARQLVSRETRDATRTVSVEEPVTIGRLAECEVFVHDSPITPTWAAGKMTPDAIGRLVSNIHDMKVASYCTDSDVYQGFMRSIKLTAYLTGRAPPPSRRPSPAAFARPLRDLSRIAALGGATIEECRSNIAERKAYYSRLLKSTDLLLECALYYWGEDGHPTDRPAPVLLVWNTLGITEQNLPDQGWYDAESSTDVEPCVAWSAFTYEAIEVSDTDIRPITRTGGMYELRQRQIADSDACERAAAYQSRLYRELGGYTAKTQCVDGRTVMSQIEVPIPTPSASFGLTKLESTLFEGVPSCDAR